MLIEELLAFLDKIAPPNLKENWDSDGLQIGSPSQRILEIHVALEAELSLLEELPENCALVVHHPPLFKFKGYVDFSSWEGKLIKICAQKNMSIIALHTRFDKAKGGIADEAAKALQMQSVRPLVPQKLEAYKLVTFLPEGEVDVVAEALFEAGAGIIGKYQKCSFRAKGIGTFLGSENSSPKVGKAGKFEKIDEIRLEVLVRGAPNAVVDALLKVHPYEEPAYDIYPIFLESKEEGLGRVGELEHPISVSELAKIVSKKTKSKSLRIIGVDKKRVKRIAILPGAGGSYVELASRIADVFVTSDVKYHEAILAQRSGLTVIEVDHGSLERFFVSALCKALGNLEKKVKIIPHEKIFSVIWLREA